MNERDTRFLRGAGIAVTLSLVFFWIPLYVLLVAPIDWGVPVVEVSPTFSNISLADPQVFMWFNGNRAVLDLTIRVSKTEPQVCESFTLVSVWKPRIEPAVSNEWRVVWEAPR